MYYRLVLVVGEARTGKTSVLTNVADSLGTSVINTNLSLSQRLLDLTAKQRSQHTPNILDEIIEGIQPPVILDNTEILFDKTLNLDPLRLLLSMSRKRVITASWNGSFTGGRLFYAEPGHHEYRKYDSVDALVVGMDGKATVDSVKNNREAGQA
jgi:hypothetical protein